MSKIKSYVYEELLTRYKGNNKITELRYERVTSLARLTTKRNMLIAVYNDGLKKIFSHKNAIIINTNQAWVDIDRNMLISLDNVISSYVY
jgi:hypothetical protein